MACRLPLSLVEWLNVLTYTVHSPDECPADLFEFRYDIYVQEMGRKQLYACHETRTIRDFLDDTGYQIIARTSAGEIAGCVRINFLRDGPVGPYTEYYALQGLTRDVTLRSSICTRLMVRRRFRCSAVTIEVMRAVYDFALSGGIQYNYIDCNRHLVKFFSRFGYSYLFSFDHPEYGDVSVLKLDLHDLAKLEQLSSPFAESCRRHFESQRKIVAAVE